MVIKLNFISLVGWYDYNRLTLFSPVANATHFKKTSFKTANHLASFFPHTGQIYRVDPAMVCQKCGYSCLIPPATSVSPGASGSPPVSGSHT